jgi:glycosyltransferase involved in cell wall biosynthesis
MGHISIKIAVIVPQGFLSYPEAYGGGIVRAYKVYTHQIIRNLFNVKFYFYDINLIKYPFSIINNLIALSRQNDILAIVAPWENDLNIFPALIFGLFRHIPVVIIFNAVPLLGEVGTNAKSWTNALRAIPVKCIRGKWVCILKALLRNLWILTLLRTIKFLNQGTFAIAITPGVAQILADIGLRVEKIYPGNGTDPVNTTKSSVKLWESCYVASPLHVDKGIIDVLAIWRLVTQRHPSAKLLLIGRISDYPKEQITALIERYGLKNNIQLLASAKGIPRAFILKILTACRTFLYPTRKDVWPLVIGEALSAGVPVVTYKLPDIEHAYGWCPAVRLVNTGDIVHASKELLNLLNDQMAPQIARYCAQKMTWRRVALLEAKAILMSVAKYYNIFGAETRR